MIDAISPILSPSASPLSSNTPEKQKQQKQVNVEKPYVNNTYTLPSHDIVSTYLHVASLW